jgi:hypothetical protein
MREVVASPSGMNYALSSPTCRCGGGIRPPGGNAPPSVKPPRTWSASMSSTRLAPTPPAGDQRLDRIIQSTTTVRCRHCARACSGTLEAVERVIVTYARFLADVWDGSLIATDGSRAGEMRRCGVLSPQMRGRSCLVRRSPSSIPWGYHRYASLSPAGGRAATRLGRPQLRLEGGRADSWGRAWWQPWATAVGGPTRRSGPPDDANPVRNARHFRGTRRCRRRLKLNIRRLSFDPRLRTLAHCLSRQNGPSRSDSGHSNSCLSPKVSRLTADVAVVGLPASGGEVERPDRVADTAARVAGTGEEAVVPGPNPGESTWPSTGPAVECDRRGGKEHHDQLDSRARGASQEPDPQPDSR